MHLVEEVHLHRTRARSSSERDIREFADISSSRARKSTTSEGLVYEVSFSSVLFIIHNAFLLSRFMCFVIFYAGMSSKPTQPKKITPI